MPVWLQWLVPVVLIGLVVLWWLQRRAVRRSQLFFSPLRGQKKPLPVWVCAVLVGITLSVIWLALNVQFSGQAVGLSVWLR